MFVTSFRRLLQVGLVAGAGAGGTACFLKAESSNLLRIPKHFTVMASGNPENPAKAGSMYEFSAVDIDGNEVSLEKYRDHVCIVVNVASKWGKTPVNYEQLEALYKKYAEAKGLRILAFPCNQFGGQEPGTNEEIKAFAAAKGATFDLFSKIDVNGSNAHPLFVFLKARQGGTMGDFIKWNFTKFVVDKNGQPVARFAPTDDPIPAVEKEILKHF